MNIISEVTGMSTVSPRREVTAVLGIARRSGG